MTGTQRPTRGPQKMSCPCSDENCNLFGTPRKKVWRGETIGHVRGCPCRRCAGSRHKKNAGARERRIAKDVGGERSPLSGAVSGWDIGTPVIKIEETSNHALVRGLRRYVESKQFTSKVRRLSEQTTFAWAFLASWEGKPRWYLLPAESFRELHEWACVGKAAAEGKRTDG